MSVILSMQNLKQRTSWRIMTDISIENILKNGYEYEQPDPEVFVIKNFLTEDECDYLTNLARSKKQEEWEFEYMEGIRNFVKREYGLDSIEESGVPVTEDWYDKVIHIDKDCPDLVDKMGKRAEKLFKDDHELKFSSFITLQRQYTGSELRGHYDQFVDKTVEYAAVIYPNDDYTDGKFYFKHKDISLRPPKGSILIFPGSEEYWHGVYAVGEGPDRYAMPAFIHNKSWTTGGV